MLQQYVVEKVYGKACFEVFSDMPETDVEFNNAMTNISAKTIPVVLEAYDSPASKPWSTLVAGTASLSAKY